MIKLKDLLLESAAADQAKDLGLTSAGFGNWRKGKDGPVVARTKDGKLVPIGGAKGGAEKKGKAKPQAAPKKEMNDPNKFFRVPKDIKENPFKTSQITYGGPYGDDNVVGLAMVSFRSLHAAGVPSDVGPHVHSMVRRLKRALKKGKKLPPIQVAFYADGTHEVDDGNTRVLALKVMGYTGKIPAVVGGSRKKLESLEGYKVLRDERDN